LFFNFRICFIGSRILDWEWGLDSSSSEGALASIVILGNYSYYCIGIEASDEDRFWVGKFRFANNVVVLGKKYA